MKGRMKYIAYITTKSYWPAHSTYFFQLFFTDVDQLQVNYMFSNSTC